MAPPHTSPSGELSTSTSTSAATSSRARSPAPSHRSSSPTPNPAMVTPKINLGKTFLIPRTRITPHDSGSTGMTTFLTPRPPVIPHAAGSTGMTTFLTPRPAITPHDSGPNDASPSRTAARVTKKKKIRHKNIPGRKTGDTKSFPFLRLPAEIRNSVYEYALGNQSIYAGPTSKKTETVRDFSIKKRYKQKGPFPPNWLALTCANRQVYQESRLIPFVHNSFGESKEHVHGLRRLIERLAPAQRKAIETVRVQFTDIQDYVLARARDEQAKEDEIDPMYYNMYSNIQETRGIKRKRAMKLLTGLKTVRVELYEDMLDRACPQYLEKLEYLEKFFDTVRYWVQKEEVDIVFKAKNYKGGKESKVLFDITADRKLFDYRDEENDETASDVEDAGGV